MPLPNPGMSFTPFDPLPASDLNDIVENVESLADGSGFDAGSIGGADIDFAATGAGGIWWEELGRTSLGVAGDRISVTGLASRKYIQVRVMLLPSGTMNGLLQFNNDTSTNYSWRLSTNGGADGSGASQVAILLSGAAGDPQSLVIDIVNIANQEKLVIAHATERSGAGAGNVPNRREVAGKWANTSVVVSRIDVYNDSSGDYAAGSEVVVLGHN